MSATFVGQETATGRDELEITDEIRALIRTALDEDLRYGPDVTTAATVAPDASTDAAIVSRQHGVVAGIPVAQAVFADLLQFILQPDDAGLDFPAVDFQLGFAWSA